MTKDAMKYAASNIKLILEFNKSNHIKPETQEELCKMTGVTPVTMRRRLKTNKGWKVYEESYPIATALKMTANELFFTRMVPNGNADN